MFDPSRIGSSTPAGHTGPVAPPAAAAGKPATAPLPTPSAGREAIKEASHHEVRGGKIYVTNTVLLDADPGKVLAALRGKDWSSYWSTGVFSGVPAGVKLPPPVAGEVRFGMTPIHLGPIAPPAFAVQTFEPFSEALPGGGYKVVIPYKLSGGFTGDARLEIAVTPDGKTALTSKWEGVKGPSGIWPLPQILAAAHVWTEKKAFHNLGRLVGQGG